MYLNEHSMRLKEIKLNLENAFGVKSLKIQNKGNNTFSLTGWVQFKYAILLISKTPVFKDDVEDIVDWSPFVRETDSFNISQADYQNIIHQVTRIQASYDYIVQSMEYIDSEIDETLVAIKIPHPANLSELAKYITSIDKIFTPLLIHKKIDGQVKFKSFDKGSDWVEFITGNSTGVALVASVSWAAAVIYKKTRESKIFNEYANALTVKTDSLKDMESGIAKMIEQVLEIETKAILKEFYDPKDHEQIARIQLSIKLLSELINKGAEVHPALNQPEKVINLFPDFNKIDSVESKIKKIGGSN